MAVADGLTRPLRTRERAAIDAARAALRKIALRPGDVNAARLAEDALEKIAVLLGERDE
jgi:hypothetical protein